MTDYGDIGRDAAVVRLTAASEYERFLDGLVWLNAGCDYPEERRNHVPPCGPANRVNGRSMRTAYESGLHGVEMAFLVPQVTLDVGAAFTLLSKWFPENQMELRTGQGAASFFHRAVLEVPGHPPFVGTSRLGGAAAVCVCLLKSVPSAERELPGYLVGSW